MTIKHSHLVWTLYAQKENCLEKMNFYSNWIAMIVGVKAFLHSIPPKDGNKVNPWVPQRIFDVPKLTNPQESDIMQSYFF